MKRSEFCDLVRAAARVRETEEGLPRGWTNAAIMKATKEISRSPAVLCERCKTEVALANALDLFPSAKRPSGSFVKIRFRNQATASLRDGLSAGPRCQPFLSGCSDISLTANA